MQVTSSQHFPFAAVTAVLARECGKSVGGTSLQSKSSGDEVRGGAKAGSSSAFPLQHYCQLLEFRNFVEWIGQTHLVSFYTWKGAESFKVKVAVDYEASSMMLRECVAEWTGFPSDHVHHSSLARVGHSQQDHSNILQIRELRSYPLVCLLL